MKTLKWPLLLQENLASQIQSLLLPEKKWVCKGDLPEAPNQIMQERTGHI